MEKRASLEIIKDILKTIQENNGPIKITPLLRKSNLSSQGFFNYLNKLLEKKLVRETMDKKDRKYIAITDKGLRYLSRYEAIVGFIEEFEL